MLITLLKDSKKESGIIKHLRFRLRDTDVDIKYRSDIQASVEDLDKFDSSGRPNNKARFGNYNEILAATIESFMLQMQDAYNSIKEKGMPLTYDTMRAKINEKSSDNSPYSGSWIDAFRQINQSRFDKGYITASSFHKYDLVSQSIERFAKIFHFMEYRVQDITPAIITQYYDFLESEHLYIDKYKTLYKLYPKVSPSLKKSQTVSNCMRIVKSFFVQMVEMSIIDSSPFDHIVRDVRKNMMKYDQPAVVFLRASELLQLRDAELPKGLQESRDLFYLQCLLGCRISDFVKISRERIDVNEEGVPYYRYVPLKTSERSHTDVETPLLKSAVKILKDFNYKIPSSIKTHNYYNKDIRTILLLAKIDRGIKVWDEESRQNVTKPLYELASSKIARKTFEDMMVKVQLNLYTTGLHAVGSSAIHNYTALELIDRYRMMCLAFDEPAILYDKDLNEIKNSTDVSHTSTETSNKRKV